MRSNRYTNQWREAEGRPQGFADKVKAFPSFLYRYTQWRLGFCRRLRSHEPIFIFQMGKVGSRSISDVLARQYKGAVIHGHAFSQFYPQGEVKELYRYVHGPKPPARIAMISPIREPIARNISAFFQNFEYYTGEDPGSCTLSLDEVRSIFIEKFTHDEPLEWFNRCLKPNFGIDVFDTPFPDVGFATYETPSVRLLVFRLELPHVHKQQLLQGFLNMPSFALGSTNKSSDKPYSTLYRRFLSEVKLPRSLVDGMCDSKYFRHFYPPDFIETVRGSWTKPE